MTVPEHNALRALTGGFSNTFNDSNTTDLLTSSMTSLVMACTETPENINILWCFGTSHHQRSHRRGEEIGSITIVKCIRKSAR